MKVYLEEIDYILDYNLIIFKGGKKVNPFSKYWRTVLIFDCEDKSIGEKNEPSGYIKIEINGSRGKFSAILQNLKDTNDKLRYKLNALKYDESKNFSIELGDIEIKDNKGQLEQAFNPNNINNTGYSINDFNIFAVTVKDQYQNTSNVIAPLVTYRNKKFNWEDVRQKCFLNQRETCKKTENIEEDKFQEPKTGDKENIDEIKEEIFIEALDDVEIKNPRNNEKREEQHKVNPTLQNQNPEEQSSYKQYSTNNMYQDMRHHSHLNGQYMYDNRCFACPMNYFNHQDQDTIADPYSYYHNLEQYLSCQFQGIRPFKAQRKDYKWWRVFNLQDIYGILKFTNITIPILLHKISMLSHNNKYRYLIIGTYTNKELRKKCLIIGLPGVLGVDCNLFGNTSKWVPVYGGQAKAGIFGYWLLYIDIISKRMLSIK